MTAHLRVGPPEKSSVVIVTNAAGAVIATIDPITRKRTNVNGDASSVLTLQGWNLNTGGHISWPAHAKPARIVPLERNRWGKITNRDGGRRAPRAAKA